ncbi:MAG TPA: N-acetyltransferase [Pseudobdellovibrionaceae bacterium]|nr:N-acetyltransferase [Pseudobdellovibrionaceae bacterium]
METVLIRVERPGDHLAVEDVVRAAFLTAEHSSGTEDKLVRALRASEEFVSELSLVAEISGRIVGHVLLTPIRIVDEGVTFKSLALAPVSVLPEFQGRGVGAGLMEEAHRVARRMGYRSVILLGHPGYYPRFGYRRASLFGISAPFDVPDEALMALELTPGALEGVHGVVSYPPAFSE